MDMSPPQSEDEGVEVLGMHLGENGRQQGGEASAAVVPDLSRRCHARDRGSTLVLNASTSSKGSTIDPYVLLEANRYHYQPRSQRERPTREEDRGREEERPLEVPTFPSEGMNELPKMASNNKKALDAVWPQELLDMTVPDLNRYVRVIFASNSHGGLPACEPSLCTTCTPPAVVLFPLAGSAPNRYTLLCLVASSAQSHHHQPTSPLPFSTRSRLPYPFRSPISPLSRTLIVYARNPTCPGVQLHKIAASAAGRHKAAEGGPPPHEKSLLRQEIAQQAGESDSDR